MRLTKKGIMWKTVAVWLLVLIAIVIIMIAVIKGSADTSYALIDIIPFI